MKYNKAYIPYKIVLSFFSLCILLVITILSTLDTINTILLLVYFGIMLVLFGINIICTILYYNRTTYIINEKEIILKKGVIYKKTTILTYDKIHAVDKKEGILQRLFGLASLSLDSGSTTNAVSAEIVIYEKKEVITEIMERINSLRFDKPVEDIKEETEGKIDYVFKTKSKVLYSLLNCLVSLFGAIVFAIVASIILAFAKDISKTIYLLSLFFIGISLIIFIGSFLYSITSLYNFKISKNENEIIISSGFFVTVVNKLAYKRIHAVIISQGLIKRLFGFASISLSVVGYGADQESTQTTSYLVPFCHKKDVNKYLELFLPDYIPIQKETKSPNLHFHYSTYLIVSSIIYVLTNVLSLGLLLINKDIYLIVFAASSLIYVLLSICNLFCSFLQYKNAGLSISDNKVIVYTGSLCYSTAIIKKEHLISIQKYDTRARKKRGYLTIVIHYYANAYANTIKVKILDEKVYTKLKELTGVI